VHSVTRKELNGLFIPLAMFFSFDETESFISAHQQLEKYTADVLPLTIFPESVKESDGDYLNILMCVHTMKHGLTL
jgi:hypothetical protein